MRDTYRGMLLGQYDDRNVGEHAGKPRPPIVIGLGFGDEGKGMTVAYESGRMVAAGLRPMNVRFNGGPQAAHNVRVRLKDGRVLHHTHSQFGSGTFYGASTVVTDGMLFDPLSVIAEADHMADVLGHAVMDRLTVDASCPVVIPTFAKANRALESMRGENRHGSTGLGIGIARTCERAVNDGHVPSEYMIDVNSLIDKEKLADKIAYWREWIAVRFGIEASVFCDGVYDEAMILFHAMTLDLDAGLNVDGNTRQIVRDALDDGWTGVVFEGSQGMLLDERYGWFPHVTYGDMTPCEAIEIADTRDVRVIGVTRSYQTRHGAGPMPTEGTYEADEHDNGESEWAGSFRTGLLDLHTTSLMAHLAAVDDVAISCLDRYPGKYVGGWGHTKSTDNPPWRVVPMVCASSKELFIKDVQTNCDAMVSVVGEGCTVSDWKDIS